MVVETRPDTGSAVSEQDYLRLALAEPERHWELHQGRLREKPRMAFDHNHEMFELGHLLRLQLDPRRFVVGVNGGRLRGSDGRISIPDVFVVPTAMTHWFRGRSDQLETYDAPLPLVVEIWSPSTGDYDVEAKLAAYQERGDGEIWRLHPYERTMTVWRRQADGAYTTTLHHGGVVYPASLPEVEIDLSILFDL